MSKQRGGTGVDSKTMPSSDYDQHFLPTISPYKSLSSISQTCEPNDSPDSLQHKSQSPNENKNKDGVINERKRIPSHERHEETINASHLKPLQASNSILPATIPSPPVISCENVDRKKDRKSQARRYLVEGLSSSNQRYNDPNRRGLYRCHTFNISDITGSRGIQRSPNNTRHSLKSKIMDSQKDSKRNGLDKYALFGNGVESQDMTKATIEKWNDLILELNSHQYAHKSKPNHISVLSDSSASDADEFPLYPAYSKMPPEFVYPYKSSPSTGPNHNGVGIISNKKLAGLGFTRYRPITPNLLEKLDKLKLSSRKRTQRWINQIQDQRRAYAGATKAQAVHSNNNIIDQTHGNVQETNNNHVEQTQGNPRDSSDSITPAMETLKPLKRTESYGSSTATRHSSFAHAKKAQAAFL